MSAPELVTDADRTYVHTVPSGEDSRVRLWSVQRLPFTTDQAPEQKAMVASVGRHVRALAVGSGASLTGVYACADRGGRQPDAENICFYNWGGGLAPPGLGVVSFERSYSSAPPAPQDLHGRARHYHEWAVRDDPSWDWWTPASTRPVVEWRSVPLATVQPERFGRQAWLALRRHPDRVASEGTGVGGDYVVTAEVRVPAGTPSPVKLLKGAIDGPVAAFQRFAALSTRDRDLLARHALRLGWGEAMDAETLSRLAAHEDLPALFPRPPFNANGLDPCDERCVGGRVSVVEDGSVEIPELSGRIEPVVARGDARFS